MDTVYACEISTTKKHIKLNENTLQNNAICMHVVDINIIQGQKNIMYTRYSRRKKPSNKINKCPTQM